MGCVLSFDPLECVCHQEGMSNKSCVVSLAPKVLLNSIHILQMKTIHELGWDL